MLDYIVYEFFSHSNASGMCSAQNVEVLINSSTTGTYHYNWIELDHYLENTKTNAVVTLTGY